MKKLAVLFPGIGYTCDKPLLYYSWKVLKKLDYEVFPVPYTGFPDGVKGNAEKMQKAAQMALDQAEEMLKEINWSDYEDIVFVSKSVGTVVGTAYARRHEIVCRHILFTPVEGTFRFAGNNAIAFHGTADPWVDTNVIKENCRRLGIPLYITEAANHSLETGDVDADIIIMGQTIKRVREFVSSAISAVDQRQ